jgi:hypothetical protein
VERHSHHNVKNECYDMGASEWGAPQSTCLSYSLD